jgi:hypothetical protein
VAEALEWRSAAMLAITGVPRIDYLVPAAVEEMTRSHDMARTPQLSAPGRRGVGESDNVVPNAIEENMTG